MKHSNLEYLTCFHILSNLHYNDIGEFFLTILNTTNQIMWIFFELSEKFPNCLPNCCCIFSCKSNLCTFDEHVKKKYFHTSPDFLSLWMHLVCSYFGRLFYLPHLPRWPCCCCCCCWSAYMWVSLLTRASVQVWLVSDWEDKSVIKRGRSCSQMTRIPRSKT